MRPFIITTVAALTLLALGLLLARSSAPSSSTHEVALEALEALEVLEEEQRLNPCADDPGFCYEQAIQLAESSDLGLDDFPKLRELFGDACDAGWALACQDLAMMAEQGIGEEVDLEKALRFYERACDLGHEVACVSAQFLQDGHDHQDWGPELWSERCSNGEVEDCVQLAIHLDEGGEFDTDLTARELFELSCEELDQSACFWFARHLEERDKEISAETLDELYQRACDAGVGRSCSTLASRLDHRDVKPDLVLASMEKACEFEDGHGCYYLGLYHADQGDEAAAIKAWRVGCEVWHGESCDQLALAIVKDDREEAGKFFERACHMNIPSACYNFGVHLNLTQSPPPFDRSRQLFEYACDGEHYLACAFLANMLRRGQGGPEEPGRAAELAALACQNGIEMACQ